MAINKVIDRNNNVLIDLTNDTVSPNKVLLGTKFHGADGKEYTGSLQPNELDRLKYTFIDYDGDLMYQFTDEEIDAMTELPAGPDHTDDNLTFQEWNWTLEELKAWDRTRSDRPIVGANLITTDGKNYLYLETPAGRTLTIYKAYSNDTLNYIDWGDGTITSGEQLNYYSHTYSEAGAYTVVIDIDGAFRFDSTTNASTAKQYLKRVKLGNVKHLRTETFYYCHSIQTVNVPANIELPDGDTFESMFSLKVLVFPRGTTKIMCANDYSLKTVSIPNTVITFESNTFNNNYSLENIVIPDSITTLNYFTFQKCLKLKSVTYPKNLTLSLYNSFNGCTSLEYVDLRNVQITNTSSTFNACYTLKHITLPYGIKTIDNSAFYYNYSLERLTLPDSVESIANSAFQNCHGGMILDLSQQTKVITLSGNIGLDNAYNKILVPIGLLDQYKTASYWSNYAACMVGV